MYDVYDVSNYDVNDHDDDDHDYRFLSCDDDDLNNCHDYNLNCYDVLIYDDDGQNDVSVLIYDDDGSAKSETVGPWRQFAYRDASQHSNNGTASHTHA